MYLRNVHPSKSLNNFHQVRKLSFRSQEPRRPRFSFFHSSQCQRADPTTFKGRNVQKSKSSKKTQPKTNHPGKPGQSAILSETVKLWERSKPFASSTARYLVNLNLTVNQRFRFSGEPETRRRDLENFFSVSASCLRARRRLAPRSSAMSGL